jgi:metal-responsive CopG/Arc/MetJ family transcriptional regulator
MDEDTLARVDRLARDGGSGAGNRSRIVRQAVREYVSRLERLAQESREADIVRRHRTRMARQARALIREQAKP